MDGGLRVLSDLPRAKRAAAWYNKLTGRGGRNDLEVLMKQHTCVGREVVTTPSWWEADKYGIPMFRGCEHCVPVRLKGYHPDRLTAEQKAIRAR